METLFYVPIYIFFSMLLGVITGAIAQKKGESFFAWWLFGTLIFIIALPMVLLMDPKKSGRGSPFKSCPYCSAKLKTSALNCPSCKRSQPISPATTLNAWETTVGKDDEVAKWAKENPEIEQASNTPLK